jgi:hypothetical protein
MKCRSSVFLPQENILQRHSLFVKSEMTVKWRQFFQCESYVHLAHIDVLVSPSSIGTLFLWANEKTGMHIETVNSWDPVQ